MANAFAHPELLADASLQVLVGDLVLARTIRRDFDTEFTGKQGSTVNVRRPATLSSREYVRGTTTAITTDEISEATVPVTLNRHPYSAVALTDEELTLDIVNFTEQVTAPQALAVAEFLEEAVVAEMETHTVSGSYEFDANYADVLDTFGDVRKGLRDMKVPASNLYAAVGTSVAAALLKLEDIRRADASGSTGALRDASIGRLLGFEVVESNRLAPDEAFFYHRDAFALVTRATVVPEGATSGGSASTNGFAIRILRDYDAAHLSDRSIISTLAGTKSFSLPVSGGSPVAPVIRVGTA